MVGVEGGGWVVEVTRVRLGSSQVRLWRLKGTVGRVWLGKVRLGQDGLIWSVGTWW